VTAPQPKTPDIPLAVWPCAQRTSQWQRHGRYLPDSNRHPAKMLPELARRAIETYSRPGDLVVDPMCGIGTTLVEGTHLDRRAIGIELEPRWAELAEANLAHARNHGAPGDGRVIRGDARDLHRLLTHDTRRNSVAALPYQRVDLVLTSPPYACEIGVPQMDARGSGHSLCPAPERNYSPSRANLGHARRGDYLAAMADIYAACQRVLKPGGFLVLVTKDMRAKGALRNLAGDTVALCERAGLAYWQHVIALLATIRDDQLIGRPSFWQTLQIRKARARGEHTHLVCHEDVLVFRRPAATTTAAAHATADARRAA
jgi:DNA modification methylase